MFCDVLLPPSGETAIMIHPLGEAVNYQRLKIWMKQIEF